MTTQLSADERLGQMVMQRSASDRLLMCARMFATARALALAGIAAEGERAGGLNERQALFLRFYGSDFGEPQRGAILAALGRPALRP